jgi:hypothetical protein
MSCSSKVTKQNIDDCKQQFNDIKPENVSSTGNETLDAARKCAKSVEKNNKLGECNSLITAYNDQQSCLLRKAQDNWQTDKTNRENSQRDWDNRRNSKKNDLRNETKTWDTCVDWAQTNSGNHNDYCRNDIGSGWEHVGQTGGGCTKGFGKGICQRTWDQAEREANNQMGPRPGDYNISRPTQDAFPFYQQITGADVQCCTNYFDCGNNCTSLNNKQSCLQAINSTIEDSTKSSNSSKTSATSVANRFEIKNYIIPFTLSALCSCIFICLVLCGIVII